MRRTGKDSGGVKEKILPFAFITLLFFASIACVSGVQYSANVIAGEQKTITVTPKSAFDSNGNNATAKVLSSDNEYAVLTVRRGAEAYVEMNFVADISDSSTIDSVTLYYEHHETSKLDNLYIEVYDSDTTTWVRYSVTPSEADTLDTLDITAEINTEAEAENNRIRYVCYESGGKAEKGYLDHAYLNITYSYVPDTTPPAKVTGVTVTTVSCIQLDVSWTANNESDLDHYNVYRNENRVASPTTNSYSDTGLTASTTYYYKITAVDNSSNEGKPSDEKSGTTTADSVGPVTSDVAAEPNPTNGAETVTLTADISDTNTCNSGIAVAEYFINTVGAEGTGINMNASDGTFGTATEGVTADINVSDWAVGDYTLYVHGKDEAGNWGVTSSVVLKVTEMPTNVMHVHSINMSLSKRTAGKNTFTHATAVVTIVNATNNTVEGAAVYGTWSEATPDSDYGLTNSTGQVSLDSDEYKNAPSKTTFTFTVDDVIKSGWDYISGENVETNDSITVGTYDFATGAGVDKWAYRFQVDAKPPVTNDVLSTEFNSIEYDRISRDDPIMQRDFTTLEGYYAAHRFNFNIAEPVGSIVELEVLWTGAGTHIDKKAIQGATLYLWNFNSGAYEQLNMTASKEEVYLTGVIIENVENYIDADGTLTILVEQNSPQDRKASRIRTDYVKVNITPTSTAAVSVSEASTAEGTGNSWLVRVHQGGITLFRWLFGG